MAEPDDLAPYGPGSAGGSSAGRQATSTAAMLSAVAIANGSNSLRRIPGMTEDASSSTMQQQQQQQQGQQPGSQAAPAPLRKPTWLDAWLDPVAGVSAFTPCVHTCDLFGDGDYRLVVADQDQKLKVWKGTQKAPDHALLDVPVAITSFIGEAQAPGPRLPSLAVAAGPHVYIYRNLRPYYKFVVPPEDVNTDEQDIWARLMATETVIGDGVAELTRLQDSGVVLTSRSLQLMNIGNADKKLEFVEHWQGQPLIATTVITCMETMKLSIDEPDALSCLVIGTESGRVLILNPQGTAIVKNVWLGVTPAFLAIQGEFEVGYRITIAGRDGKMYLVRNGELTQNIIQLESPAVGLVRLGKAEVAVGCMNDTVHCYTADGNKSYSIYMPDRILCMQRLEVASARKTKCLVVALANGEVRVYHEKRLASTHTMPTPVTALWFGRYGREDNTLVTITKTGTLDIKILPRTANLEASSGMAPVPPEQEIPLQVPKKTRLYVEQTQREREQAGDMHRMFQRDLAKLRLTTARAYVKILTDGQGAAAFTSSAHLSLQLSVQGLGPRFKLLITLRNDGATHVRDVPLLLLYNEGLYATQRRHHSVPLLVPTVSYTLEVEMQCLVPDAGNDAVMVVVLNKRGSLPLLQAKLQMPISEPEEA